MGTDLDQIPIYIKDGSRIRLVGEHSTHLKGNIANWTLDIDVYTRNVVSTIVLNTFFVYEVFHNILSTLSVQWDRVDFETKLFVGGILFLLITICGSRALKRKAKKAPVFRTDSLYDWSVFDLAKTAYEPGHTEAVVKLVEQYGYDLNHIIPTSGLSLFLCACLSGRRNLITYMISGGADVKITTRSGDTCLYLATYGILNSPSPNVHIISDLIKAGCNVNGQNFKGYTPLHRAASKGNIKVIKCLLKHGADPYICSKSGIYPIDSAITAGHMDAAELVKIEISNPHVWEVVEPHTPPRIQLGLQSPPRKHLLESSRRASFSKVLT